MLKPLMVEAAFCSSFKSALAFVEFTGDLTPKSLAAFSILTDSFIANSKLITALLTAPSNFDCRTPLRGPQLRSGS